MKCLQGVPFGTQPDWNVQAGIEKLISKIADGRYIHSSQNEVAFKPPWKVVWKNWMSNPKQTFT